MEQITVPQFLDVEDKIIGPITVRQFIEMLIGGLIIFIFYKIFDFSLFIISGLIVFAIVVVVAFLKVNGQAFHFFMLNFISTMKNPKLKIWKKVIPPIGKEKKEEVKKTLPSTMVRRGPITYSKLSELALIVDTGGLYEGESVLAPENNKIQEKQPININQLINI